ncbi:uncharacterized protein [Ptychodera flava]|uniref:uncharacterized protein isoform X2 n=1 Tax=Ptychodera flava TaxID=63121 RepID=UPI00396A07F8
MNQLSRALFSSVRCIPAALTRRDTKLSRLNPHQRILGRRACSTGEDDQSSEEYVVDVKMKYKARSNTYVISLTPETYMPTYRIILDALTKSEVRIWSCLSHSNDGFLRIRQGDAPGDSSDYKIDACGYLNTADGLWKVYNQSEHKFSATRQPELTIPIADARFSLGVLGKHVDEKYRDHVFLLKVCEGQLVPEKMKIGEGEWWLNLSKEYVFKVVYHYTKDAFTIVQKTGKTDLYFSSSGNGDVTLLTLRNHTESWLPIGFKNPEILFSFVTSDICPSIIYSQE